MVTDPALRPGRGPPMLVASVGYGTVKLVDEPAVARAWAMARPLRTKLTTGNPKPRLAKPFPAIVNEAGGEARSIGLGVMEFTIAAAPVTVAEKPAPPVKVTLPANEPREVGENRTVTV